MGGLFGSLAAGWRQIPRFWQNILVGLVIALSLPLLRHTDWVKSAQNFAMDTMIRLNASLPRMTAAARGQNPQLFTLLDIDEKSYQNWKEPYHIPRGKLARLIRFALEGGARLVVVDVNLNNPGVDKVADRVLLDYLAGLPPKMQARLILLRLAAPPDRPGHKPPYDRLRPPIVDTVPAPAINWAHPYFQKDRADDVVRRWNLYLEGCFRDRPIILPSVQLMSVMLTRSQSERQKLESAFADRLPQSCAELGKREGRRAQDLLRAYGYDLAAKGITERILYTMPYTVAGHPGGAPPAPDLEIIPAHLVTDTDTQPSDEAVRNRIVFIGASYQASHDWHKTPLGEMPGALVLVNATKSLLVLGQITPPGAHIVWPLILALIIFMSLVFSWFRKLTATFVISAIVVLVLMPISFFLFKYGIWFDFAAPLLGIQVHQTIAEFNRAG